MRLTTIVNALFESGGGDIYIGETRLDGIIIDKDNGELVASTIESDIDSSGLRISAEKTSVFAGYSTRLVATAKIEYDSYTWGIDGTAGFVGDIDTGNTVYITDSSTGNNIVTLIAVKDSVEKRVQIPIDFTDGFFSDVRIIGPSSIDIDDPVRYVVVSDISPDDTTWSVNGGATLTDGSTANEVFVTIDGSNTDIMLTVEINRAGFVSHEETISINTVVCDSSDTTTIEKPVIIEPRAGQIGDQFEVTVGEFTGKYESALIEYEIDVDGGDFTSPIFDRSVGYATSFSIDIDELNDNEPYLLRVRFSDNKHNKSFWSNSVSFYKHIDPVEVSTEISSVSNYWAMNTQNPIDEVSSNNMSTQYALVKPNGTFDNRMIFNGSTTKCLIDDVLGDKHIYTISIVFTPYQKKNAALFMSGTGDSKNGLVITSGGNIAYIRGEDTHTSFSYELNERVVVIATINETSCKIYKNGNLENEFIMASSSISSNTDEVFIGAGTEGGGFFYGDIDEIAFWADKTLTSIDVSRWSTKTKRPFGQEKLEPYICSAVDRPVLLSYEGSRIVGTKFFGVNEPSKVEYQLFDDGELLYETPIMEKLVPFDTTIKIAKEVSSADYKVRARYYDSDNNKSPWSRPVLMDVYFIPPAISEFLLVSNKDNSGLSNVTQTGLPEVSNGYCQFGSSDYFSFDRVSFTEGTISLWVKFDDLSADSGGLHTMILGGDNSGNKGYLWYNVSSNQFRITDAGGGEILYSNSFTPEVGEWYNIIITMDQYESRIYVNMIDLGGGNSIEMFIDNIGTAYLGSDYDFIGGIKGFRAFQEVLDHDERLDVFQEYD